MGQTTGISWTTSTFNPVWGCVKVSPGCNSCYAETLSRRYGHNIWGPAKTTPRRTFGDKHWNEPRLWNIKAAASGQPWRVFCGSMCDVFEDHPQLTPERAKLWTLIDETPALTWQLLTKRPENIRRMLPTRWHGMAPENVWLGTSAEDQVRADQRIPRLWDVGAPVYWVSYEPALGPVDFTGFMSHDPMNPDPGIIGRRHTPGIQWIIVGGESGPGARPFNLWWAEHTIAQCRAGGSAPFVKQMGSRPYWGDAKVAFQDRKGADPAEWPEPLRVQEFPSSALISASP